MLLRITYRHPINQPRGRNQQRQQTRILLSTGRPFSLGFSPTAFTLNPLVSTRRPSPQIGYGQESPWQCRRSAHRPCPRRLGASSRTQCRPRGSARPLAARALYLLHSSWSTRLALGTAAASASSSRLTFALPAPACAASSLALACTAST